MVCAFPDDPFTRASLHELGISQREFRRALAKGEVRAVLHGVWARAEAPDSIDFRARAASLVLPPHVVVADRTAAWLHGVDCREPAALDLPPIIEVVSRRGHQRSRRRGLLGGERDLADDDVMTRHGLTVTTPLRTAVDLACRRGRASALAVLDAFAHHHDVSRADLERMAARFRGRRGVTQLRELIPLVEPRTESTGESWSRLAIHDAGLPAPQAQVWVRVDGSRYRLDLAWRWHRIAVEYDGREFHDDDVLAAADDVRREALRRAGWIVIVVRAEDLSGPRMEAWLDELRRALADRGPRPGRTYARASRAPRRART